MLLPGALGKLFSHGAGAGADFQDGIVAVNAGLINQKFHQVEVDEEILTQPAVGGGPDTS